MPKPSDREIEELLASSDEEDEALLRHVLLDDEPPQGLHRGGWNPVDEEYEWD